MLRSLLPFLLTLTASAQDNPRLLFARSLLDANRGKAESADQLLEAARLADPTAQPLVEKAARKRVAEDNIAGAVTLYRELAAARPDRLSAQLRYADFLRNEAGGDDLAERMASEVLESTLKHFPGNPQILERLFRSSQARGNRERSLTLFEALVATPPLTPAAMLTAEAWSRTLFPGDDPKAQERLDRLFISSFEAYPDSADLARAASEHFRRTRRLDQAISLIQRHVKAAPSSLDLRTRLGILLFSANRNDEGVAALQEVLAIDSRRALAHESLAKFYRQQEKPELARPHADAVLKIRGGTPQEFITLADEWLAAGDPRAARLLLEKSIFDHPQDAALAAKLAIASRRDPETRSRSSRLFREAETLLPANSKPEPAFLAESAEALIDEDQLPAAEDRLRRAIKAYPPEAKQETARTLRRLAELWESQGKNADAGRSLRQRADTLDPPK